MPETLRIALDILALIAVLYAAGRRFLTNYSDVKALTRQIAINTAWIAGHEVWSRAQSEELQRIRQDIAYIRGKLEHAEKHRHTDDTDE